MRIENAVVERYRAVLTEKSRPPSRGGNGGAWHRHELTIGGESYSCLAPWRGKLVYASETVSFDWEWNEAQTYRNITLSSLVAHKKSGEDFRRGNREDKRWRTADARLPARRSEWKD